MKDSELDAYIDRAIEATRGAVRKATQELADTQDKYRMDALLNFPNMGAMDNFNRLFGKRFAELQEAIALNEQVLKRFINLRSSLDKDSQLRRDLLAVLNSVPHPDL